MFFIMRKSKLSSKDSSRSWEEFGKGLSEPLLVRTSGHLECAERITSKCALGAGYFLTKLCVESGKVITLLDL